MELIHILDDVLIYCFGFIELIDLLNIEIVCKKFQIIISNSLLWKRFMIDPNDKDSNYKQNVLISLKMSPHLQFFHSKKVIITSLKYK